jgi:hypothetical protein
LPLLCIQPLYNIIGYTFRCIEYRFAQI